MKAPISIYKHPDGPSREVGGGVLIVYDDEGKSVTLPIGPKGLLEMAAKLTSLAADIGPLGDLAERAGAGIALDCCDALLAAKHGTQGERIQIIQDAIVSLRATGNPMRAAGGFACIVEDVVMRGLKARE